MSGQGKSSSFSHKLIEINLVWVVANLVVGAAGGAWGTWVVKSQTTPNLQASTVITGIMAGILLIILAVLIAVWRRDALEKEGIDNILPFWSGLACFVGIFLSVLISRHIF